MNKFFDEQSKEKIKIEESPNTPTAIKEFMASGKNKINNYYLLF